MRKLQRRLFVPKPPLVRPGGLGFRRHVHRTETEMDYAEARPRVLILGGGFAGLSAAVALDPYLAGHPDASVLVVDQSTDTMMTPLLWPVAAGRARAEDVVVPIRAFQRGRHFHVLKAEVQAIDLERRRVLTDLGPRHYDYLVIALGSVTSVPDLPGLREHARRFRTAHDALALRDRLVDAIERAHHIEDPVERAGWLTFVVAGAGDTGVELAATIQEFLCYGLLKQYPWLAEEAGGGRPFRVVLVGRGERLVPLMPERTSRLIHRRLVELGAEIQTGTAVSAAQADRVVTSRGVIEARTLFWAAGIEPPPVVRRLPIEHAKGGAVVVDEWLRLPGHPEVFVAGDAAWAYDSVTRQPSPPTAQAANAAGAYVGRALGLTINGYRPPVFRWRAKGHLVLLGYLGAVAEVGPLTFAGPLAWALWHGFYLSRLPSWPHRIRLVVDWGLSALLGREVSQTRL